MDVFGGESESIARYNRVDRLHGEIQIIHGPGCPDCVTAQKTIDTAIDLGLNHQAIILSFGDMLRVPGTEIDLLTAKSMGADVQIIYSPIDALKIAAAHPDREVVLFDIGFETTAPIPAHAVLEAVRLGLNDLPLLTALF